VPDPVLMEGAVCLRPETWTHKVPGFEVSSKGRIRKRIRKNPMPKFKVVRKQVGGGISEVTIEANMMTVGMGGALEFWRITEQGKTMVMAIAREYWVSCEEAE